MAPHTKFDTASEFLEFIKSVKIDSFTDEVARRQAASTARALFYRLESPYERFLRHGWEQVRTGCL